MYVWSSILVNDKRLKCASPSHQNNEYSPKAHQRHLYRYSPLAACSETEFLVSAPEWSRICVHKTLPQDRDRVVKAVFRAKWRRKAMIQGPQSQSRLIRLSEVTKLTGIARSTIYKWMAGGTFPRPLKLSVRHVAWREHDILEWIADLSMSQGPNWPDNKPGLDSRRNCGARGMPLLDSSFSMPCPGRQTKES
jgi:prophage regulatory protein